MFRAVASAQSAEAAEASTDPKVAESMDISTFASWETHVYQYDRAAAVDFGFTVGSVKGTANSRLLIMDTTRSKAIRRDGKNEIWGCGFRFQVEVSDISLSPKLTLPAIAAAMEITALEASVRLEVKGYTGVEMWEVIPSPKPLDVDTYRTYMSAVEKIQAAFAKHPDNAVPVLLAEDTVDILFGGINETDVKSSVVVVWALNRIRAGQSLSDASGNIATEGPFDLGDMASEVLARTYESVLGPDGANLEPNDEARLRAASYLESITLNR